MGKNFSRNNASGKRKVSDRYFTPYCLTREFVEHEILWFDDWQKHRALLEPACGDGAIVKVLAEYGYTNVVAFDLNYDGTDFLTYSEQFDYMITNPPYSLAHEFILHAKEIISLRFALLLPLTYLQGSKRLKDVWSDRRFPLESIYVFNRYPMLGDALREDGKIRTGMQTMAWFVWNRENKNAEPVIRWLDIDKYILKKGDIV